MTQRYLSLLALLALSAAGIADAAGLAPPRAGDAASEEKSLAEALAAVAGPLGVSIHLAPHVQGDRVRVKGDSPASTAAAGSGPALAGKAEGQTPEPRFAGSLPPAFPAWPEPLRALLRGYNHTGTFDAGRLVAVNVTGRNGDGRDPPGAPAGPAGGVLSYLKPLAELPAAYRQHAGGSVYPVAIDRNRLLGMRPGDAITVDLPGGRYRLIHDRLWRHPNGDASWVGHVEGADGRFRTLLTLGKSGSEGQFLTPAGLYTVESEGAGDWLVDIAASGLRPGSLEGDTQTPLPKASRAAAPMAAASRASNRADRLRARRATLDAGGRTLIDLLVLHTAGFPPETVETKINNAVALANQALTDSRATALVRLVSVRPTDYSSGGSNSAALDALTFGTDALIRAPRLRKRSGADVVMLFRPFRPNSQGGCGEAWVNGAESTAMDPKLAFAVVGYGAAGGYYCSNYALAHELGHVLGANHDRQHANVPGRFPYSYGYGRASEFGDVMSYFDPEIGLYANPDLVACNGEPCGIPAGEPRAADVVRTFENTAGAVSGFSAPAPR